MVDSYYSEQPGQFREQLSNCRTSYNVLLMVLDYKDQMEV